MKTTRCFNWMMLALVTGVGASAQITNLGIAPVGNQSVIYWPASLRNAVLQSTTNLSSPNWQPVTNAEPLMGAAVSNASPALFFSLHVPPPGMVYIPAGTFVMGDTVDGEGDAIPTNIYVSAFDMDTNLVTFDLWQSVNNYATNHGYSFVHVGFGKTTNSPVYGLDWYDAVKWSNARSQQAGLPPVYYTDAAFTQLYTNGEIDALYVNAAANGFRLPTEAEWERAARGGVSGLRFPWGNTISGSQANYNSDTNAYSYDLGPQGYSAAGQVDGYPYTSIGGSYPPNGYGLCDMSGNLLEWCWDWYGTPYGQPATNNPTGPASGTYRILRGGMWNLNAYFARTADRDFTTPGLAYYSIGFRCARGL